MFNAIVVAAAAGYVPDVCLTPTTRTARRQMVHFVCIDRMFVRISCVRACCVLAESSPRRTLALSSVLYSCYLTTSTRVARCKTTHFENHRNFSD